MQKKILIICPSMWPMMRNWGETQRMYFLANFLGEHGWEVHTISLGYRQGESAEQKAQHYEPVFLGEIEYKERTNENKANDIRILYKKCRHLASVILNKLCEKIYGEYNFREVLFKRKWVHDNKRIICDIIEREEKEIVLISGPSFTLFRLGNVIKKQCPKVKLVLDYRDPWYLWKRKSLGKIAEKKCLADADLVVGVSEAFRKDMIKIFKLNPEKIKTVYNGYSKKMWDEFVFEKCHYDRGEQLILTYTGMIFLNKNKENYRNLFKVIEVVKKNPQVELFIVGATGIDGEIVEGNIHYIGNVSQKRSFEYMMQSDVLISLHDTNDFSQKYVISGKFYDYLKSRKVIWHIGAENSLMSSLVNDYGLGISCTNCSEEIENSITDLLVHWQQGTLEQKRLINDELVEFFARENQNSNYNDILSIDICTK